ncbi:A disintegrin and metallopeptidase domain 3-like [Choloepus didactylus]|uniref:A disintegrin and metallopeptidase domain 3-like n=1 Tax=Choloepus didactylus TaxID=27675 RepID=UPI00189E2895|nr:A disintegrin and metallopeptidase domain 3-like [Choloepus didactylus]
MFTYVLLTTDPPTPLLQITVPRKIETTDGVVSESQVTYVIEIDGKTYTLHLEKQSFLHPLFLVYSYNKSGILHPDYSFIKEHCFYQGYVAEITKSVVTVSTCSGLRGILQLENVSYGIEPLESAITNEHMLYQIKNNEIDFPPVQENYSVSQFDDQSYRILVKSNKNSDMELLKRKLKIQIIMDKALYDYMGSEVAVATEKVVHVFSLLNTMFSHLKMTVTLTYLEIWSDTNKISTDGDADDVLQRFLTWKQKFLIQRPYDMAYFLIYRDHPNYMGATYHGMACNPKLAAGIALYAKSVTLESFSVVMAQLLGINLGLTYDDVYNCYCPGATCIMNPEAIRSRGVKFFSSCSMDGFKHMLSQPEFECLRNQTVSKVVIQGKQNFVCGNGILEQAEQCDCGEPKDCQYKKCCNPRTCTLIGFAECGTGPCCDKDTCLISERGKVCRERRDLCDFTEYCNGMEENCGVDIVSADFEPCYNDTAFCFQGLCRSTDFQCKRLFGKFARGADYLCAEEVNLHSDDFGNCYLQWCDYENTICGKVVCHWTHAERIPHTTFDVQYTYYGGHVCVSASFRNFSKQLHSDTSYVDNGTKCDEYKFCYNARCTSMFQHPLVPNCNSKQKCNGHGVCNNRFHCQCDVGYAPPACESTPSSPGGSIDDGFWLTTDQSAILLERQRRRRRRAHNNGLLISFYIFLPFLVLTVVIALKWKNVKGLWNRVETVSEGSISEDSSSNSNLSYN